MQEIASVRMAAAGGSTAGMVLPGCSDRAGIDRWVLPGRKTVDRVMDICQLDSVFVVLALLIKLQNWYLSMKTLGLENSITECGRKKYAITTTLLPDLVV